MIGLFTVSVGLPFFAVAANAPLLQKWFANTGHRASDDPYLLYDTSILALLAYPALAEPFLRLREQSQLWAFGFGLLILFVAVCGFALWRR